MQKESPVRTVALLRFPVLGSGILNYMFSLSPNTHPVSYAIGNLIGQCYPLRELCLGFSSS